MATEGSGENSSAAENETPQIRRPSRPSEYDGSLDSLLFYYDPIPLFVVNGDSGAIFVINRSATETFQYPEKELLNLSFWKLFDIEEAVRLWKELHRIAQDEQVFVPKLVARKKDGQPFFVHLHARRFGETFLVRTIDITDRLESEGLIIQASKMVTLGEVAMGLAHELNQPLNVMRLAADFLTKTAKRDTQISQEDLLKVSSNMSEHIDRAVRVVRHLQEFGKNTGLDLLPVDVNEPIREVFDMLGQQLKARNIEVDLDLDDDLPNILADRYGLEQIFLNLVTNARDAMESKEQGVTKNLTVRTYIEADQVVASVSDTGKGIPPQMQDKIFAPFFSTKRVGKGTGLGLSICRNLVGDFRGRIEVESTPDVGTTFKVSFPVQTAAAAVM
jgi:PAS domain S-box-containing protein